MDFMPESPAIKNHDQAHQIIKGKRTDHPSSRSPVTTTSNSYKTLSSDEEEEEDMANCLIMLAHSVSPLNDDKSDNFCCRKTEKLKIRSVTEMTATYTSGGNTSIQSYECKTCNRVFQSFQALGGHRASHKKPKLAMENKPEYFNEYQPKLMVVYEENKIVMNKLTSPVTADCSIQTGHKNSHTKVHQCSICGSEFLSGQALGGHMRRHRTAPLASISPTTPKLSPEIEASDHHVIEKSPVLSLDLNLPPPEVVEDAHSSFQFAAGSLQQPLVFSAPALVDCHY